MGKIVFNLNGQSVTVDAEPDKPLLWVLREDLRLTGTKYGCGMAICGCCVVHLNGDAIRSCVTPVARAEGKTVITIDALSRDHSLPLSARHRSDARTDGVAVEMNDAATADGHAAAILRSSQTEVFAQDPQQRLVG